MTASTGGSVYTTSPTTGRPFGHTNDWRMARLWTRWSWLGAEHRSRMRGDSMSCIVLCCSHIFCRNPKKKLRQNFGIIAPRFADLHHICSLFSHFSLLSLTPIMDVCALERVFYQSDSYNTLFLAHFRAESAQSPSPIYRK